MNKEKKHIIGQFLSLFLVLSIVLQGLTPFAVQAATGKTREVTIPAVEEGKGHIISVENYSNGAGEYLLEPVRVDLSGKKHVEALKKAFADCGQPEVEVIGKMTTPDFPYIDSIAGIKGDEPVPGDYVMNDPVFGPRQWMVSFANNVDPWKYLNWKPGAENNVIRVIFTTNNGEDIGGVKNNNLKVNKDELIRLIADARVKTPQLTEAIAEANKVVLQGNADQETVNRQVEVLKKAMEDSSKKPVLPEVPEGKGHIVSVEDYSQGTGRYLLEPVRVDLAGKRHVEAVKKAFADCGQPDVEVIGKMTTPDFPYIDSIAGIKGDDPVPGDYVMNDPVFGPRQWMVSFENNVDPWKYLNWKPGAENNVIRIIFTTNNGEDIGGVRNNKLNVNKDALVRLIADARMKTPQLTAQISEANQVVLQGDADQNTVDAAYKKLENEMQSGQTHPEIPQLKELTIDGESQRTGQGEESIDFTAVKMPAEAQDEIVWSVDDTQAASIDPVTGKFQALKPGTVEVTATAGNLTAKVTVTILLPAQSVEVQKEGEKAEHISIIKNKNVQLTSVINPSDSTDQAVWESKDPQIAKVDQTGKVTGVKKGETIVTVSAGKASAQVTVNVTEIPATGIQVSENTVSLKESETVKISASAQPSDTTDEIVWNSKDPKVAEVKDGMIKGISKGETIVTVSAGEYSKEIKVKVAAGPYIYFEYKDGRPDQHIDKETNSFTLSTIDEGYFKVGNYTGDATFDCEKDITDHDGYLSTEYIIKSDGRFDPYGIGRIDNAKVFFDGKLKTFSINIVSSGITELRTRVNGELASLDHPFTVTGASTAWVSVEGRRNSDEEFIPIPNQAVTYTTASPLNATIDRDGKLTTYRDGTVVSAMLQENYDIRADLRVVIGHVPVEDMNVTLPKEFYIDKWNSLGGYYVGVQPHSGYQISFTPSNATNKDVTWEALTPDIATHMEQFDNGIIPKKAGTARFKVTSKDNPSVSKEVSIDFKYLVPAQSVSIEKTDYELAVGTTIPLYPSFTPGNASEQRFDWTFDQEGIIRIEEYVKTDESGTSTKWFEHKIVGLKNGTVKVTGTPMDTTSGCNPISFTVKVGNGGDVLPTQIDVTDSIRHGLDYLETQPKSEYGDEWTIFTMLRSGRKITEEEKSQYLSSVKETIEKDGKKLQHTDYARIIFTLTAMGEDPRTALGIDVIEKLCAKDNFSNVTSNQIMWTLIALDTHDYEIQKSTNLLQKIFTFAMPEETKITRERLIEEILKYQREDGSFSLNLSDRTGSVDVTAMALQSLAKYQDQKEVKNAINNAHGYLRSKMTTNAGFIEGGGENSCTSAQVITALTELGMDPLDPANGYTFGTNNLISRIQKFETAGGYALIEGSKSTDLMATEQVTYALESYRRFLAKENSLYDMTDIKLNSDAPHVETDEEAAKKVEAVIAKLPEEITLDHKDQVKAARRSYDNLTEGQKALVKNVDKLLEAEEKIKELEKPETETVNVILSVERFTIGQGYVMEPVIVEMKKGDTVSDVILKILGDRAILTSHNNYLSAVKDADLGPNAVKVPEYIQKMGSAAPTTESTVKYYNELGNMQQDIGVLGEFTYSNQAGWIYHVNGIAPQIGIANYEVKQNDVIRLQYTLYGYGSDLTGYLYGESEPFAVISNKDDLTKTMADVNAQPEEVKNNAALKEAYANAVKAAEEMTLPKEKVQMVTEQLKAALEQAKKDHVSPEPENPEIPEKPQPENPEIPEKPQPENPEIPEKPQPEQPESPETEEIGEIIDPASKVILRGAGLTKDMELRVSLLGKEDEDVQKMREEIPSSKGLIRIYNIQLLKDGKEIRLPKEASLILPVPSGYEGLELKILFRNGGKVIENHAVVTGKTVELKVGQLGSFGIVVDVDSVGSEQGQQHGHNQDMSHTSQADKESQAAKTGDEMMAEILLMMGFLSMAAVIITVKKNKRYS